MLSNSLLEREAFTYKRKRRLERHVKARTKKRIELLSIISLGLMILVTFHIVYSMYISSNSKDLGFSVEHNFTTGFSSNNKLLRVQKMSLIYFDGETAIVEASGLAKNPPHKTTTVKGSFKKNQDNSWYLEKYLSMD